MKHLFRKLLPSLALVVTSFAPGCASMIYTSNYDNYVTQQLQSYTYTNAQLTQIMNASSALLFEQGYRVLPPRNNFQLETEWGNTGSAYRRYMVTAYQTPTGATSLEFHYIEETYERPGVAVNQSSARDYQMEAAVLKRVSPADWARIDSAARNYADQQAAR